MQHSALCPIVEYNVLINPGNVLASPAQSTAHLWQECYSLNAPLCSAQHQSPTMIKIAITIAALALALPSAYASKLELLFEVRHDDQDLWSFYEYFFKKSPMPTTY